MTETRASVSARKNQRSRRLIVTIAAGVVILIGAGIFLWLAVFKDDESDSSKAAKAIDAGLALQAKGDLAGAYEKYTEAYNADKNNKFAIYDLAVVDALQNNLGLAEQRYQKVLEIDPNYEPALYNLAIIEQQKGNQQAALSLYQRAVQSNPGDANAHFNLALTLRLLGYPKVADAQMKIARQLNPELKDPGVPKPTKTAPSPSATK